MIIPTSKLFRAMLGQAEKEEYAKIVKSLFFLEVVFQEIKEKFNVDMEKEINTALKKKEKEAVLKALQKAIFYDIKDIFFTIKESEEESPKVLKSWLRMAELNYNFLLAENIKEKNFMVMGKIETGFEIDRRIKKAFFRCLYLLVADVRTFAAKRRREKKVDFKTVAKILTDIEKDILTVFPEFKPLKKKRPVKKGEE